MIAIVRIAVLLLVFSLFSVPAITEDGDANCLTGLKGSLVEGAGGNKLSLWTTSSLAQPCDSPSSSKPSSSNLDGITCNNNRVVSIILSAGDLSGTLSPSIALCTDLQTLDVSSNSISGPLPTMMGNLSNLVSLNLSSNAFSGSIPTELSSCIFLNFLDLHNNKLSGPIPGQLGLLPRLKFLDVSDNKLTGQIPTSLSNTSTGGPRFNESSFANNKDLYGYPLAEPSSHGLSVLAIVGIGLGSGLLSLIVSSLAVCIWLRVSEQGYAAQEGKISHLVSEP